MIIITVLAVLDVQKLFKVHRRSLPYDSKLGNIQKVHGIKFPKVPLSLLAKPQSLGVGQSD